MTPSPQAAIPTAGRGRRRGRGRGRGRGQTFFDYVYGHGHSNAPGRWFRLGARLEPRRLALLALVLGCTRSATDRPPGPVTSALIVVDAQFGADADTTTAAFASLNDIARRVERQHRGSRADMAADIAAVLFEEMGFQREIEDTSTRFFHLSSVLRDRKGSCLGLGALLLAIAERLDVPVDGVLLPGHFFVRTRGPGAHNIELLRRGETMPDAWYREKYGPWPDAGAYNRPVTATELAAIHWYNRGHDLQKSGDLEGAQAAFARAAAALPDFAEASASLGAVQQRRGDLAGAERSYQQAARAWPDLPGLRGNLDRLHSVSD